MIDLERHGQSLAYGLMGLGIVLILLNMGFFGGSLLPLFFVVLGLGFLSLLRRGSSHWWALFPGFSVVGVGAMFLARGFGVSYLLLSIATGFFMVYYLNRKRVWALIPAGVLTSLSLGLMFTHKYFFLDFAPLFFFGLFLTFLTLYLLKDNSQTWAVYPALACAGVCVLLLATSSNWVIPLAFLLLGGYLLRSRVFCGRDRADS